MKIKLLTTNYLVKIRQQFTLLLMLAMAVNIWGQLTLPAGTSYPQTFDGIGSGLPTGWTVRTGATATSVGTNASLTTAVTPWNDTAGAFKNFASTDGLTSAASAAAQSSSTDRALGLRQSGSVGDPGGAFVLQIANTTGKSSFKVSLKHQLLDAQPRTAIFTVQYTTVAAGNSGWNDLGTFTTNGTWGSTSTGDLSLGTAFDNISNNVWIRVVTLASTTGSGNRDSYGIDDFNLTWTAACAAPTVSATTSFANSTATGIDLSGNVTAIGGANVKEVGFNYGTSATLAGAGTASTPGQTISTVPHPFTQTVSGLVGNTLYYYRAYAINNCATSQTAYSHASGFPTFTTVSLAPISAAADIITTNSFRANWTAPSATQGAQAYTYHLEIDDSNDFSSPIYTNENLTATNYTISSLAINTPYYYRIRIKNAGGYSVWSTTQTVTTAASSKPVITASSFNGTVNVSFSQNIAATNNPDSYAVVAGNNLPAGLVLDTTTGAITGIPTAAGTFTTNVTATKGAETSDLTTLTFTIAKASQTITGLPVAITKIYGDADYALTATASSGLAVTYTSSNTAVATVTGSTVKIIGAGNTIITAQQIGNANYNAAPDATQAITVNTKELTITGLLPENKVYDQTTSVVVNGTPEYAGLVNGETFFVTGSVTWAFADKNAGINKAILQTGSYDAPSANYTVAQPGLKATITKKDIAITTITANDKAYNGTVTATFSNVTSTDIFAGDTVTFAVSGSFSDANAGEDKPVTILEINLSGTDGGNYDIPLLPTGLTADITKVNQTITFNTLPATLNVGGTINLATYATTTSGLALSYISSAPQVASISGTTLTGNNMGSATISVSQAGNTNYNAATSVQQTVNVVELPVALAQWDFFGVTSSASLTTLAATEISPSLNAASAILSRGSGAAGSAGGNSFRTTGFQNNGIAITNTDYFQTSFTATQEIMSLTSIRAHVVGTDSFVAAPGVQIQFAYSLNGTTYTLINSPVAVVGNVQTPDMNLSSVTALQNIAAGTTVYFRFYASGQTTTGGYGFSSPGSGQYGLEFYGRLKTTTITWDGTAWSNFNGPDGSQNAIIDGAYTQTDTTDPLEVNNLTVTNNGVVTIEPDQDVVVNGNIILSSSNQIVMESDANLVQTGAGVDANPTNFSILVKRNALLPTAGYTFWSSPITGQNLYSFSDGYNNANGGTGNGTPWNGFYVYNEANDYFVTKIAGEIELNAQSVFETGRGYAIKGQNRFTNVSPYPTTEFTFTGKINNGQLFSQPLKNSCAVEEGCEKGYNLVGNPYPSSIDFEALYAANSSKIYGTAYFWTNNDITATQQQQGSNYSGNNYAIYNLSGGNGPVDPNPGQSDLPPPNGIIKLGQGFIIKSKVEGAGQPIEFNNNIRVGYDEDAIFYNSKKADKDRFWLMLTSPANVANTILVAYMPQATNGFEINYDGELFVIGSDSFYSLLGSRKLAIQGKADFNADDKVSLGNVYSRVGEYKISIKNKEGIFKSNQNVYLKDKVLNKVINLSQGDYIFQANKATDETRFEIVYKEDAVLGTDASTKSDFTVYRNGDQFVIRSSKNLGNVELYDVSGKLLRQLYSKEKELIIEASSLQNGMFIIKAENSGDVRTKKIIK